MNSRAGWPGSVAACIGYFRPDSTLPAKPRGLPETVASDCRTHEEMIVGGGAELPKSADCH